MRSLVHFIPLLTTAISVLFAIILFRRWRLKPAATYLAWWTIGVVTYGTGTLVESLNTLLGWQEWLFRAWFISGALLGGVPLAQGSVYLFLPRRIAHRLTAVVVAVVLVASLAALLTPIDYSKVEPYRLSGAVMVWQWVRLFSPFLNTYGLIFLVGGAAWSAWRYWRRSGELGSRVVGNVAIALGGLLPGIGGSFTRFGMVEVLYVTEFLGIVLIWLGYQLMVSDSLISIHLAQRAANAAARASSQ